MLIRPSLFAASGRPALVDGPSEPIAKAYLARLCTETPNGLLAVPHKSEGLLALTQAIMDDLKGSRWELTRDSWALMRGIVQDAQRGEAE